MKSKLIILILLMPFFCFAQKKINLVCDSVSATFTITSDSINIVENIKLANLSSKAIYIPNIRNREIYFFTLKKILGSHLGVMISLLGTPYMSSDVDLIKILPKSNYELVVKIKKKQKDITNFHISFDYVREDDIKETQQNVTISMEKYVQFNRYAYISFEDL